MVCDIEVHYLPGFMVDNNKGIQDSEGRSWYRGEIDGKVSVQCESEQKERENQWFHSAEKPNLGCENCQ